jgi:hypothetical protein
MAEPYDVARWTFFNSNSELRCGWRIAVFVLAVLAAGIAIASVIDALSTLLPSLYFLANEPADSEEYLGIHELGYLFTNKLITLFAALIATAVCARFLERRSLGSVGFKLHRGWLRDFSFGSALGAAAIAWAVAIIFLCGAVVFNENTTRQASLGFGLATSFVLLLVAGATEELLFRGFAFQALTHDLGPPTAVIGTSILFAIVHVPNPSSTVFSTINTMLAGVWLSLAYLKTRSLWLATGLHWSWNFVQGAIFGLPISGLTTFNLIAWFKGTPRPPRWVSGLDYGPEGGAAATAVLILSSLIIWKAGISRESEEMRAAIRHGSPPEKPRITPEIDKQSE